MESINISFSANRQTLTGGGLYCASNTVHYIIADFELGDGWDGFDSVRAVWSNDFKCISTVLDPDGSCTVPHEVLERRGKVSVNLVGSILEDDELTDRLTTYPVLAITVDANAKICGTETAEVTPSQFEQYVAIVIAEVEKVTGMTAVAHALPEGSEPTANYSDGVLTLGIPKGDTGATGNGISSIEFNEDYSLTFYFTDSEPFTTPSIRGAQGARGYGIASVEKIGSAGLVDTYRINFEDPSVPPTTFTVTNGEEGPQGPRGYTGETGNGIDRIELTDTTGAVKTYTIYFTDGTTYDFEVTDGEVTLAELASVLPTDTASGAIASFEDGSDLFDYLSCVVEINPVQAGSGTPSPQNVRPITGWTGCEVDVAGVNLFDIDSVTQVHISESETRWGVLIDKAGTYTVKANASNASAAYIYGKVKSADGTYGSNIYIVIGTSTTVRTITINNGEQLAVFNASGSDTESTSKALLSAWEIQIETGSTATPYTPYNGQTYPVSWQTEAGTAYGGTVDLVTGVLTVTGAKDTYDEQASIGVDSDSGGYHRFYISNDNIKKYTDYTPHMKANLCPIVNNYAYYGGFDGEMAVTAYSITSNQSNYVYIISKTISSVADLKTFLTSNPLEVWYELAQAQTYQLDPVQVACLLGRNNVWADCGDIEGVKYKADVQKWVEKKLGE